MLQEIAVRGVIMATLNLSYEDLASVICLAVHLANADGNVTDDEMEAIVKSITDQYNFEGKQDLLKEYINDGMNMQPQEALKRIAAFGPTEKQWTSNFFVKTIVADGNLEENEKSLYWDIMDKCGLPDHNLEGSSNSAQTEANLERQTAVTVNYKRVKADICDGAVQYVQWDRGVNVREKVFGWFQDAESLQFFRRSRALDAINKEMGLAAGWNLVMIFAPKEYWADPKPNRVGSRIAGEAIWGPVLFVLENDDKTLMGFNYKSFIQRLLEILYSLDNGILVAGEENPQLSRRYFETALTELGTLKEA